MHRHGRTVEAVAPAHAACLKRTQTTVVRAYEDHASADRYCARCGLLLQRVRPPSRRTNICRIKHATRGFGISGCSLRVLTVQPPSTYGWLQAFRSCDTTWLRLTRLPHKNITPGYVQPSPARSPTYFPRLCSSDRFCSFTLPCQQHSVAASPGRE